MNSTCLALQDWSLLGKGAHRKPHRFAFLQLGFWASVDQNLHQKCPGQYVIRALRKECSRHMNHNFSSSKLVIDNSSAAWFTGGRWFWPKIGAWKAEEGMLYSYGISVELVFVIWLLTTQFGLSLCNTWWHVLLCIIRYFDQHGIIRDIVQSHLLQTIALFAMEPPVSLDGEDIRNEKVLITVLSTYLYVNHENKVGFCTSAHGLSLVIAKFQLLHFQGPVLPRLVEVVNFWHLIRTSPLAGQGSEINAAAVSARLLLGAIQGQHIQRREVKNSWLFRGTRSELK